MLNKVRGLVVRSVDIKDNDRLITIYTEEFGIITAMAKGARSYKSKHIATTMPFCYSNFVLFKKGEHYWIRESELIESFFDIRNSIEGLALATYILEVLGDVATAEFDRDLMRLCLNSLYAISSGKYELNKIKGAFEIRCMSILGFMPDMGSCQFCDEKIGEFYFDIMDGKITCLNCHDKAERRYSDLENSYQARIVTMINESVKIAFEYCIYCPIEKIFSFSLSSDDLRIFGRACELYIVNHLERDFRSLEFYKEVKR